ncbi:MAG: ATP-binding protein [Clostridia bacterium]|nr:ATP-binding protein [Clostridia bacterium]
MTKKECFEKCLNDKENIRLTRAAVREEAISRLTDKDARLVEVDDSIAKLTAKLPLAAISGDEVVLGRIKDTLVELNAKRNRILKEAGISDILYDCEKCRDTGIVGGKYCDCVKAAAVSLYIKELSLSAPICECRFENFDLSYYPNKDGENGNPKKRMTEILKLCTEYVINFNPANSQSLLFMGNTGLGKTHLSLSVAYELILRGFDVIYGSAYNLFAKMESEHFGEHSDTSYNEAVSCDLLIIDDLGGEFVSPYIQSLVYNIINTRLLARKPTIINTNLSMADINAIYTPRVASRLLGEYTAKRFLGNDIRQQKNF